MKECSKCGNKYDDKTYTHACPYCGEKSKGKTKLKQVKPKW